ncbi:hypothetical protein QRD89_01885 [Halobacillus sp. ACCC02827]|uniref:nucleotidyltransferase domain-containing protein n=1 Tax=Halobacillus sp. ACCC02827 TaxID=3052090 RepID=UPI0025712E97|nr:hypothetical protein [Halobacillus sp. ACCC02827]WJE16139.1 hypothetical protein QRD89_01885 [Halobacillus sp. ACCC02827]
MFEPCRNIGDWMRDFPGRWWVAGGWAVDLHIGEETRHHHDVDIALIEPEDSSFFRDWSPLGTSPSGSLRVLAPTGEEVNVWLQEQEKERFRFSAAVHYDLSSMHLRSENGLPYLNPEIVLLYKAFSDTEKNEADFKLLYPHLNEHQKEWLKQGLMHHRPQHHWLIRLLY